MYVYYFVVARLNLLSIMLCYFVYDFRSVGQKKLVKYYGPVFLRSIVYVGNKHAQETAYNDFRFICIF